MNTKMRRKQKLPAAELRALGTNQELIHCRIAPLDSEWQRGAQRSGRGRACAITLGRRLKRAVRQAGQAALAMRGRGA
jgi:hypothetical protein